MFDSLLNFRPVGGSLFSSTENDVIQISQPTLKINAYRSARPDKITFEDLKLLQSTLGIRSVIDLRSGIDEYSKETGMKLLDCSEQNPKIVDMERIEKFDLKDISFLPKSKEASIVNENFDEISITHFMVNMFGREYVRKLMVHNDWPLWKKILGFLLLLLYICFKLNLFVKFISRQIYQTKLTTLYKSTVDYSGIPIRCALELISQPENFPCIICCHAGKDRTGIVSAILLSICGFDRETIVDDYARSEFGLPVTHHEMKDYEEQGRYASRETMNQLLDHIDDKYGSMSKYLCSIGFPKESQLKLKRLLLNDIHIFCET